MNIPGKWLILTGSIFLLLLSVYLCLPYALTRSVAFYLEQENIQLVKLDIDSVRPWEAHINSLELQLNGKQKESGPTIRIACQDIHLGYHPGGLKDKQLDTVTIQKVNISVLARKQEQASAPIDTVSLLPSRWMKLVPVERINIENFDIEWRQEQVENQQYHVLGSFGYKNNEIESGFRVEEGIEGTNQRKLDLSLFVNEKDHVEIRVLTEQAKDKEFMSTQFGLVEKEHEVTLSGKASVDVRKLLSEATRFGMDIKDGVLSILNTLEIEDKIEIAFQASSEEITAKANVKFYEKKVSSHIKVQHNFSTATGKAVIEVSPFEFSKQTRILSSMYTPWEFPFDVLEGEFGGDASILWETVEKKKGNTASRAAGKPVRLKVQYRFQASNLSGFYNEIYFTGLSAAGRLEDGDGLRTAQPVKVNIKQINGGVPLTSVSFALSLFLENKGHKDKPRNNVIYLHDLTGNVLGGEIFSKKVEFTPSSDVNNFIINLKGLSVKKILELQKQRGIEGTGEIDGSLPVRLDKNGLSISNGNLEARKPGGIIRYRPDNTKAFSALSEPNIKLVMEALDNFHYQVLQSDVSYSPEGKLVLRLRMEGKNPDMSTKRPINLNINVEQNILTLLKSLRLADDIGEKIGERMKRYPLGKK